MTVARAMPRSSSVVARQVQDVIEAPKLPPLRQSEEVWDENSSALGEETAKPKIRPRLHGEGVKDHDRRAIADLDAAQRLRSRHTGRPCARPAQSVGDEL